MSIWFLHAFLFALLLSLSQWSVRSESRDPGSEHRSNAVPLPVPQVLLPSAGRERVGLHHVLHAGLAGGKATRHLLTAAGSPCGSRSRTVTSRVPHWLSSAPLWLCAPHPLRFHWQWNDSLDVSQCHSVTRLPTSVGPSSSLAHVNGIGAAQPLLVLSLSGQPFGLSGSNSSSGPGVTVSRVTLRGQTGSQGTGMVLAQSSPVHPCFGPLQHTGRGKSAWVSAPPALGWVLCGSGF